MNKIKTFFVTLFKSVTSPSYYQDVLKAPFSFSLKYFLVFNLLVTLLVVARVMIPVQSFNLQHVIDEVFSVYPSDLSITVNNMGYEINQELPYTIAIPQKYQMENWQGNNYRNQNMIENIITFDSDENFGSISNFANYKSAIVVTETALYAMDDMDTGEIKAVPLDFSQMEGEFVLTQDLLESFKTQIVSHPFVKNKIYTYVIGGFVLIFAFPMILMGRSLSLALYSGIVYVLSAIFMKNKGLSYGQVFQLGMHSVTALVLIRLALSFGNGWNLSGFWHLVVFIVVNLYLINQLKDSKVLKTAKSKSIKKKKSS